jgi:solute carrier family 25 protein 42
MSHPRPSITSSTTTTQSIKPTTIINTDPTTTSATIIKHHSTFAEEISRKSLFLSKELIAGAIAGACAKTLIAPLDRIKITFQTSSSMKFSWKAVGQELSRVWASDGMRGLFRGHSATLYRVIPYASIQFATFDAIKAKRKRPGKECAWYELLVAGAAAGAVSVIVTYPLDLARARMAVAEFKKGGVYENLSTGYRKYGFSSLYRGLSPTLLGILPYAGISFATFDTLKNQVQKHTKRKDVTPIERLLFGTLAGLAGQVCTYPIDIVRRRMQTEGYLNGEHFHHGNNNNNNSTTISSSSRQNSTTINYKYRGVIQSLQLIFQEEGPKAFFKAVGMNFIKGPLAVGTSFLVHDLVLKRL